MTRHNRSNERRGVLLLVVLGLLAIFGMIAISFVLLSSEARRAAEMSETKSRFGEDPKQDLDDAFRIVARGSNNPFCAIWPHGLLEDVYGNNSVEANVTAVSVLGNGQLISITSGVSEPERRVGSVLTLLSGAAANQGKTVSFRIVGYTGGALVALYDSAAYPLRGPNNINGDASGDPYGKSATDDLVCVNDRFVINGTPFGGTGIGFDPTMADAPTLLSYADSESVPFALRPNPAAPSFLSTNATAMEFVQYMQGQSLAAQPANAAFAVAPNEEYDAADLQNMFMAMRLPDALPRSANIGIDLPAGSVVIPSFHRPELARYWVQKIAGASVPFNDASQFGKKVRDLAVSNPSLLRKVTLRPLPMDHPMFTGSNPAYDSAQPWFETGFNPLWNPTDDIQGALVSATKERFSWDVDTDGDLIPDAIWLDLGFPVRADSEGRLFKPLFAIHCEDLGGRFSANAHGCVAQTQAPYYNTISMPLNKMFAGGAANDYVPVASATLPRGQGFGPADVNIKNLFATALEYQNFLNFRYNGDGSPGASGVDDLFSQNRSFDYWNNAVQQMLGASGTYNWWNSSSPISSYGTPSDRKVLNAVGLDPQGQPNYATLNNAAPEQIDDPYDANLTATGAATDQMFTAADLEAVLRYNDTDFLSLPPSKLLAAAPSLAANTDKRHKLTTLNMDLPCPGLAVSSGVLNRIRASAPLRAEVQNLGWFPPRHLRDVLAVKMYVDLRTESTPVAAATAETLVRNNILRLAPFDMLAGRKMDLNRPFGNGQDDNGNGVPDESGLVTRDIAGAFIFWNGAQGELGESMPWVDSSGALGTLPLDVINNVDVNGDGLPVTDIDRVMARQLYARYLYVLGLLATDFTVANPSSPTQSETDKARMVAQWAVNVVDFRDRDSIMTPFEYDICPFQDNAGNGQTWNVDGVIDPSPAPPNSDDASSRRGLVWGCEKPELLITETLAFHDRRTEDLDDDGGKVNVMPKDDHDDFDQRYRPEGSLFVELLNATNSLDPKSGEYHNAADGGIQLDKKAPGNTPVWRLAIYDPLVDPAYDPDDPATTPERSVYFADPSGSGVTGDGHQHYASAVGGVVMPGAYALIGPAATTYIGIGTNTKFDTSTRRIELKPGGPGESVEVLHNAKGANNDLPFASNQVQMPVAVIVDRAVGETGPQRLSVSEPLSPYLPVDFPLAPETPIMYSVPLLQPLDKTSNATLWNQCLKFDGTHPGFRQVHLQRLANPLLPWDKTVNPYRTVDSMVVDLTTFNGITNDKPSGYEEGQDAPIKPNHFYARERGEHNGTIENNPWTQEDFAEETDGHNDSTLPAIAANQVFGDVLHHTLGYLNWYLNKGQNTSGVEFSTLGPRDNSAGDTYKGTPRGKPFPWITWNNRPFVSELELLSVPTLNNRELLRNPAAMTSPTDYPFQKTFGISATVPNPYTTPNDSFPHLMNFFLQMNSSGTPGPTPEHFHRLLEFVYVPTQFAGMDVAADPAVSALFPAPFNMISRYREPGRININTIFCGNVADGMMNTYSSSGLTAAFWTKLVESRQGYGGSPWAIDAKSASRFSRPFRSSTGKYLVPPTAGDQARAAPTGDQEIDQTLLRQDPNNSGRPLFAFDKATGTPINPAALSEANNPDRNAYFRYQMLQRMGNLVTTRSNQYAVWITVGYFEAQPVPVPSTAQQRQQFSMIYPDGYTVGQEIGIDTGENKRHRAFYMIDRSVPVGFQRGKDLNVDDAILVSRYIE